jgi:hypothetical protein
VLVRLDGAIATTACFHDRMSAKCSSPPNLSGSENKIFRPIRLFSILSISSAMILRGMGY